MKFDPLKKKTKVVCTIGPATWDPKVMEQLVANGMNCARVNGAFADPDELDKVRNLVRQFSDKVNLMVDVKGPEVRMNKFDEPIEIKPGDEIVIGSSEADKIYPANYPDLYKYINPGQRLLVGDGDVEVVVEKVEDKKMYTKVVYGELFKPGKALNAPGAEYSSEILTDKDKENLQHAMDTGWDSVSASFIQSAESAQYVKDFLGDSEMQLIAKIEDQEGVDNIDEILDVVDGIMIARGGLGVELGLEHVPMVQRLLTKKANAAGKPVITATQMLESMTYNPRPTRAEVNDVALAVMLGSDAVMLSGESSAGEYPIEAVKELSLVSNVTAELVEPTIRDYSDSDASKLTSAIAKSMADFITNLQDTVQKVLIVTESGTTARFLSRHNIKQPIYAFTKNEKVARSLMITKNVIDAEILDETRDSSEAFVRLIVEKAYEKGFVTKDEQVLVFSRSHKYSDTDYRNAFEVVSTSDFLE